MNIPPRMICNATTGIKTAPKVFSDHLGIPTLSLPSFTGDHFEDVTVSHQAYFQKHLHDKKMLLADVSGC